MSFVSTLKQSTVLEEFAAVITASFDYNTRIAMALAGSNTETRRGDSASRRWSVRSYKLVLSQVELNEGGMVKGNEVVGKRL